VDRLKHNGTVQDAFIGGNDRYYKWVGPERSEWLGNQGGDDVDNVVADAFVKGVKGVDWEAAYHLLKTHAEPGSGAVISGGGPRVGAVSEVRIWPVLFALAGICVQ